MTISAKVIADSISAEPANIRLTTLQLRYPKFIHGEFLTHRVFSRNSSSSRAIPVERLIKDVIDDPVIPMHWGKNQPGMQAHEECSSPIQSFPYSRYSVSMTREVAWDMACEKAVSAARAFVKAGYHKQIINRLIEPFCHINTVVTATEWTNFFALRCHPDAQPEMRALADAIFLAMANNMPRLLQPGEYHLPYVQMMSGDASDETMIKLSVARCARVSYLTQDGKIPNIEDDLKLYDRLVGSVPLHASPAEHQATPDKTNYPGHRSGLWQNPHLHGNFRGWVQFRKTLPGENQ